MLSPGANTDELMARLSAIPSSVQASISAALAAYVRARTSGVSKADAIKAYTERARSQSLSPVGKGRGPRRGAASEGEGTSPAGRSSARGSSPYPLPSGERGELEARLKQAAVRGALAALRRSS